MATEWFYARNGEKRGPVTVAVLRQLAASGQLLPTDLIWKQGMKQWAAARSAKGLFPESSPIPPTPAPSPSEPPFAPIVVTAVRKPPSGRWALPSADKGSQRIHTLALGALICILAASYDYAEWPRVITVSLSLAHAILNAVLPIAIISRVREGTRKALPYSRRSLFIVLLLAVVVALGIEIGTGFFLATFQWLRFCTLACQLSLGFLLLVPVPRAAERFAIPALAGVLACLNGYSSTRSTAFIISHFSELTWNPLQLCRNILGNCSAVMLGMAAMWFSIRQAVRAGRDGNVFSGKAANEPSTSVASTVSPVAPESHSDAKWLPAMTRSAREAAGRAKATLGSAGGLVAKKAERSTLATITIPRAFAELGKELYRMGNGRADFSELFSTLDSLLADRKRIQEQSKGRPAAVSFSDRARRVAADAADAAKLKANDLQIFRAYAQLGQAAFEQRHPDVANKKESLAVAAATERQRLLDAEMAAMEESSKGRMFTPRRVLAGAGVLAGVLLLVVFSFLRTGETDERAGSSGRSGGQAALDGNQSKSKRPKPTNEGGDYAVGRRRGGAHAAAYKSQIMKVESAKGRKMTKEEREEYASDGFAEVYEQEAFIRQHPVRSMNAFARGYVAGFYEEWEK